MKPFRPRRIALLLLAGITLTIVGVFVHSAQECTLAKYLPENSEVIDCEHGGFNDFYVYMHATNGPGVKEAFLKAILENSDLRSIGKGSFAVFDEGTSVIDRNSEGEADLFENDRDVILAVEANGEMLTVFYLKY
jgi:hypothetical protein